MTAGTYSFTGSVEYVTVSATGIYDIVAYGAQGGDSSGAQGGYGAKIGGDFTLTQGDILEIIVGGQGGTGNFSGLHGGGGGGFSAVIDKTTGVDLVIAGAGGGAGWSSGGGGYGKAAAGSGQPGADGGAGYGGNGGAGGTAGGGGGAGTSGIEDGGGGSGFKGSGGSATNESGYGGQYTTGGSGDGGLNFGGFGGGGGGGYQGGGGGGGYSGGGGGTGSGSYGGGGGGSYLANTADALNTVNQSGAQSLHTGDGLITMDPAPACYRRGTLVMTEYGEAAIESLRIGDKVVTASGETRPVRWLGHRRIDISRHPTPEKIWPILVRRGAFGDAIPARDLWLSPRHAICHEGVLVPIVALQNGRTVLQVERQTIEYWHIELDSHDVVVAEGLPAESYVDTGTRAAFVGGAKFLELHPDFEPKHWTDTCLPLLEVGPEVAKVKAMLLARAQAMGHRLTFEADPHLIADGRRIEPIELGANRFAFALPAGCADVRLASRSYIPARMRAESSDIRQLGVCVKRLQIDGEAVALDDPSVPASGWNEFEASNGADCHRWTRGEAALPANARLVVVDLNGRGPYWDDFIPASTEPKLRLAA